MKIKYPLRPSPYWGFAVLISRVVDVNLTSFGICAAFFESSPFFKKKTKLLQAECGVVTVNSFYKFFRQSINDR